MKILKNDLLKKIKELKQLEKKRAVEIVEMNKQVQLVRKEVDSVEDNFLD